MNFSINNAKKYALISALYNTMSIKQVAVGVGIAVGARRCWCFKFFHAVYFTYDVQILPKIPKILLLSSSEKNVFLRIAAY